MDARKTRVPKRKPGAPKDIPRALPVPFGPSASCCHWPTYTGHLSSDRVYVRQRDAVLRLYNMGYFGKGTLSKHAPTFHRERTADNFDLHAHLLKVTDKVYLKQTFVGSVAQGCKGPAELVSLRSVAQHPFCTVRPSSSGSSAPVVSDCDDAAFAAPAVQNCESSAGSDLAAAAVAARTDGSVLDSIDSSHMPSTMSLHSLTRVGKAAVDEWESMDADVDFWLGSTTHAADAGCPGTDCGAAAGSPARELTQESNPRCGVAVEAAAIGSACTNESSVTDLALQPCDLLDEAGSVSVADACELLQRKDVAVAAVAMAVAPPAAPDHECSPDWPSAGSPVAAERVCAERLAGPEVGCVIGEDDRKDRAEPETVIHEHLELLLEEAFFLAYGLGCLKVMSSSSVCSGDVSRSPAGPLAGCPGPAAREAGDSSEAEASCGRTAVCHSQALDLGVLWRTMCSNQPRFLPRYVAYHYLRSKGWVPRDGLRFGVDFVVYKAGPPYYHASYSVVVIPVDDISLALSSAFTVGRSWTWPSLAGTNRVTENVNKELLLCYVVLPAGWSKDRMFSSPVCLQHCRVHLVGMHRLITSKEREMEKNASGSP